MLGAVVLERFVSRSSRVCATTCSGSSSPARTAAARAAASSGVSRLAGTASDTSDDVFISLPSTMLYLLFLTGITRAI